MLNVGGETIVVLTFKTLWNSEKLEGNVFAFCDVDLTIDALENAAPNNEYYIFTGDGDFAPLITGALEKGVAKIHVVSSGRAFIRAGIPNKRLATKLRGLFKQYPQKVDLIDIASLKFRIKRDLPAQA